MSAPHRVVALVLPGVLALDLAAPSHFFGRLGPPRYEFQLAAAQPGPVRCADGFDVLAAHGLGALAGADTVVVPGFNPVAEPPAPLLAALRDAAAGGTRVVSICTGAFVLAWAGLLDGRRATTHWHSTEALAANFPAITVDRNVLFVDEGEVLTSAGVAAGIDLCLHVVRRDHGAEFANTLARRTVVAPHRDGGQAQFVELPVPEPICPATDLGTTRAWALERLAEPLDVPAMARHAMVSTRTFARRFRAETGTTPHRWVLQQRLLQARRLLESSNRSIEDVAARCGFGSSASFRSHFKAETGTSPLAYRQRFATGSEHALDVDRR